MTSFHRARQPEQISQRREALLAAAAELFDAEGPMGAGLNAIAAKAGFTKSNVYRYFESRENVLLALYAQELDGITGELETVIADQKPGDVDGLARMMANGFLARPRFCQLLSILAGVLEHNVTDETIAEVKRHSMERNAATTQLLMTRLPGASADDVGWALVTIGALVAGLWPTARPSEAAARVLARPEFEAMRPDLERDLTRAIRAILASIARL